MKRGLRAEVPVLELLQRGNNAFAAPLKGLETGVRLTMGIIHQVANASAVLAFLALLVITSQTFVASKAGRLDAGHLRPATLPL